ncbi:MAG: hypothetical protein J0M24_26175 [Verrucomicrobia bacterium]|nr:hypothetical protein [Verrucomicrobiota bacterium]
MKTVIRMGLCLLTLGTWIAHAAAVDFFTLNYEQADSADGPWRPVDSSELVRQADGSISLPSEGNRFFRLQISRPTATTPLSTVRLGALSPETAGRLGTRVTELTRFLRPLAITRGTDTNPPTSDPIVDLAGVAAWHDATFASNAIPIYDPAFQDGLEPAYLEIKVLGSTRRDKSGVDGTTRESSDHRGAILMSLSDQDVGVPFFSTEGETPAERLVAKLGLVDGAGRRILTPPAGYKVMRFGPLFHALEGPDGNSVATLGTQPFKLPANLLTTFPGSQRGEGTDTEDPPSNDPAGLKTGFQTYRNYQEFKNDYLTNPVYQELRRRRAQRNAMEQQIESGRLPDAPETVRLTVGTPVTLLVGTPIDSYFLDDDDVDLDADPFAAITELRGGGLRLVASRSGNGELTVKAGRRTYRYFVTTPVRTVRPADATFVPGWQEPRVWDAGGYDEQPRYWQAHRDRWCDAVGCGPVAWAILLAWWDQHNVPSAFAVGSGSSLRTSLRTKDSPFYLDNDSDPSGYNRVIQLYDILHESCDVICSPFDDSGATAPEDMVEGWWEPTKRGRRTSANGTYFPYPTPIPNDAYMKYSYRYAWDLMDPDWNEPSNVIRRANKRGRPAIVGLGWLWHYGVSYAYRYQEFKVTADGPVLYTRRWFRVNEGWGKDQGQWYSGGDTFLGFDLKLKQQHLPPP